jgi:hypothetical protein
MSKKKIDLDKPNFVITDGKLKCIDGTSVTRRLRAFEKEGELDETVPIRLVRDESYKTLKNLEQFVRCGFCLKPKHEVNWLIQGGNVFICGECIEVCIEILDEKGVRLKNIIELEAEVKGAKQTIEQLERIIREQAKD